jgi:hypothetical protein
MDKVGTKVGRQVIFSFRKSLRAYSRDFNIKLYKMAFFHDQVILIFNDY